MNCCSSSARRCGVTDLGAEVVTFLSHATQQRLQDLLEKVSQVAQQKNTSFKVYLKEIMKNFCFLRLFKWSIHLIP